MVSMEQRLYRSERLEASALLTRSDTEVVHLGWAAVLSSVLLPLSQFIPDLLSWRVNYYAQMF